jgi:hypothetical protein
LTTSITVSPETGLKLVDASKSIGAIGIPVTCVREISTKVGGITLVIVIF